MKRILLVLSALLFAVPAFGQVTPSNLMGLGMPAQLATEVIRTTQQQTADGADNGGVFLRGGGALSGSRGGYLACYGNEVASVGGACNLVGGDVSTGTLTIGVLNNSANIVMSTGSGTVWTFSGSTGDLTSNATLGGGLVFGGSGDTISLQEATAGAACMGGLTANGATPVVVSTTCATTGARIFITRTSAESTAINAYVGTIVNGVSFSFTSEAADTGTYNWIIFKESP